MTKLSKDSMTYKVLEAYAHYLEYQGEGRESIEETIKENEDKTVLAMYFSERGELGDWGLQLSYDLENEIWTVEYNGYINFIIREEATRNEFIEAVKDFEEDPECLLYEVQDIIDEDLRKLTDLYQRGTPPTKEELDEIFRRNTNYEILS